MVVKSATKKKLMDLGVAEEYAHLLADDKKWAEVKTLTVEEIKEIVGQDAEEIKVMIEAASLPEEIQELNGYIQDLLQYTAEHAEINPDQWVIKLSPKQVNFLQAYHHEGPDDEHFDDPSWQHCDNQSCEPCTVHALHHGISGEAVSIWAQCITKFGDKDSAGTKITIPILKAYSLKTQYYIDGKTVVFKSLKPDENMGISISGGTYNKPKTKEEKTMKTIIGSKKRAEIILKAVERFDVSWNERGEEGFFNSLRVSPVYLEQFITVLLENLLKKEALQIFGQEMSELGIPFKDGHEQKVVQYYNIPSYHMTTDLSQWSRNVDSEKQKIVDELTNVFAQAICDAIDTAFEKGLNMGDTHTWGPSMGKARRGQNPKEVLQYYLDKQYRTGMMDNPFVKAFLTYDNNEGTTRPLSQKARGIHAIGRNTTGLRMFNKLPSLHISLNVALGSTNRELIMSIARAWKQVKVETTLSRGLYIRTCPVTPRPGALPNVLAKTPRQFLDGVRMLGDCMTNPKHVDYDPNGCLVVQSYIKPICSAVVVKGSDSFTIGPSNDGVTAGGGSNIVFTLNTAGQRKLAQDINRLSLEDEMEHHEIESVYDSLNTLQKPLSWFHRLADARHTGKEGRIKPTITRMRGLHTAKADLVAPPNVNGEALYIRGNIPPEMGGVIKQTVVMDVGKGSLDECIELEQMAKNGELPDGFVVYAPSGTNAAHVAGVGLDFKFPVIYGIKPQKNGTVWTEIQGWVTDIEGAEAQPYDPTPFMDYYKIGLRDGDRFWTYNLAPLSQFFHNFISGPKNDPRLEAYLAGVFTTWIIKAALAVSMAEFRHGIGSSRAEISPHRAFSHILIQQCIAGESGIDNLFQRSEYYRRLNYNELGYDLIHSMSKFYSDAYDSSVVEWCDGSFGGAKYYNSTYPTRDASGLILKLLQGEDVNIKSMINSVNKLENAVHNTGFFFNKFLGDKTAFDVGTTGHSDFTTACEHWLVTAPFYALFYTNYVNESHRVAKGHEKLIQHLTQTQRHKVNQDMIHEMPKYLSLANWDGTLREDINKHGLGHHEHFFVEQLKADFKMHKSGLCGFDECNSPECVQTAMLVKMGIDLEVLNKLLVVLNKYMSASSFSLSHKMDTLAFVTDELTTQGSRAINQTIFTMTVRKVETPEVTVTKIFDKVYMIEPNNSEFAHVYMDFKLKEWWEEVEDVMGELDGCDPHQQYDAWRDPTPWVGDCMIDEAKELEKILNGIDKPWKAFSRYWNTSHSGFSTPTKIIQSMMISHEGRYHYNTHSLLHNLHEAGKINELIGEIE